MGYAVLVSAIRCAVAAVGKALVKGVGKICRLDHLLPKKWVGPLVAIILVKTVRYAWIFKLRCRSRRF